MTVDFYNCDIDHGVFHVGILRYGVENLFKNIGLDPIAVALEYGVSLAKNWGEGHAMDCSYG